MQSITAMFATSAATRAPTTLTAIVNSTIVTKASTIAKGVLLMLMWKKISIAAVAALFVFGLAGVTLEIASSQAAVAATQPAAQNGDPSTAPSADAPLFQSPADYPRLAPFTDIRWLDDHTAKILVNNIWYNWLSLDGRPLADLIEDARSLDPNLWKKRLAEDLVEVLIRVGHPAGPTVTLQVQPLTGGPTQTLQNVSMTEDNRRSVIEHR